MQILDRLWYPSAWHWIYLIFLCGEAEEVLFENVEEEFEMKIILLSSLIPKHLPVVEKKPGYMWNLILKFQSQRGLGSDSSLVVAGSCTLFSIVTVVCTGNIENLCVEIEKGHPDNVAPCLLGGFVTSLLDKNSIYTQNRCSSYFISVFYSWFWVKTSEARRVLPEKISLQRQRFYFI